MPRAKCKKELLESSQLSYSKLIDLINSFPSDKKNKQFPEGMLNRNIRDVVGHLHHWNLMLLGWYEVGIKGGKPNMPAEGYTWKMLPELNKSINKIYKSEELNDLLLLLDSSYQKILKVIKSHSDEELFEKQRYKWTGSTSMGSYFTSATASHYAWAFRLIKKSLK